MNDLVAKLDRVFSVFSHGKPNDWKLPKLAVVNNQENKVRHMIYSLEYEGFFYLVRRLTDIHHDFH